MRTLAAWAGMNGLRAVDHCAGSHRAPDRNGKSRWPTLLVLTLLVGSALAYAGTTYFKAYQFKQAAEQARSSSDWDQLARVTQLWLQDDAEAPLARLYAGEAAVHRGEIDRAAELLENVTQSHPLIAESWLYLSALYLGPRNQPSLGERALREAIARLPDSREARRNLMRHYGLTCERGKAVAQAREAIDTQNDSPASYVYLMMPDVVVYHSGEAINARWLEGEPSSETFAVAKLLHRARLSGVGETLDESLDTDARRQELEELERSLWDALELYPGNIELIAFLLAQATDRGDSSQVESLLKRVPASAANDGRFFRHKGWLHRNREQFAAAEKAFGLAIDKDPYDWRCRHQLAEVLRLQGDLKAAESQLAIANLGAQLRKTILGLSTLETLPLNVLEQLREYAVVVGDERVVMQLDQRIALIKQAPINTDLNGQMPDSENQGA